MRTALLLLLTATVLSACADGGRSVGDADGGVDGGVDSVRSATTDHAREAVPLVAEALGADAVEAHGQWHSCMALSWRYEVFATLTAREGDTGALLDDVRGALVDAGWEDTTKVDGHVTVQREDTTVDVQPAPARGAGAWTVSVASACADYDGEDRERVENDEPRTVEGL